MRLVKNVNEVSLTLYIDSEYLRGVLNIESYKNLVSTKDLIKLKSKADVIFQLLEDDQNELFVIEQEEFVDMFEKSVKKYFQSFKNLIISDMFFLYDDLEYEYFNVQILIKCPIEKEILFKMLKLGFELSSEKK